MLNATMEFKFFMVVLGLVVLIILGIWGFKMAILIGIGLKHWVTTVPGIGALLKLLEATKG